MVDAFRQKISPPQLARRYGVSPDKVLTWIRSGELRAMDASTKRGGRPRYLIDEDDIRAFEDGRAVVPPSAPTRKCRRSVRDDDVIEFF